MGHRRALLGGRVQSELAAESGLSQATISRRVESGLTQLHRLLRKKDVVVSVALLGGLMRQCVLEAAPAALARELSKMALLTGGSAAAGVAASSASTIALGTLTAKPDVETRGNTTIVHPDRIRFLAEGMDEALSRIKNVRGEVTSEEKKEGPYELARLLVIKARWLGNGARFRSEIERSLATPNW